MKRRAKALPSPKATDQTFLAHIKELRRRLYYVVASVIVGAGLAYAVERRILDALLKPAGDQQFIYTSPMGGMNFLFNVCIYIGLIVSIPVVLFQILRFIEPMLPKHSGRFIYKVSIASAILAVIGIAFGYFIGLPNALHFLLHQFIDQQVKPLVTIQSYMSFVGMYLLSSALLLQTPLILLFINHIKPLRPRKLLSYERWVILLSFVGAFIMNPTPNVIAQSLVAVPIIISYHVGVLLIWIINRGRKYPEHIQTLFDKDRVVQEARTTKPLKPLMDIMADTAPQALVKPKSIAAARPMQTARPAHMRQYVTSAPSSRTRPGLIRTI